MFSFRRNRCACFFFFWILNFILLGNIRRIQRESYCLYALRMSAYFIQYTFPAIICGFSIVWNIRVAISLVVVAVCFALWCFWNKKLIILMFSKKIIATYSGASKFTLILDIYNRIGAAISEEMFFRYYILSLNIPVILRFSLSVLLFWLSHYLLPWSKDFKKNDYFNQISVGAISAILFLLTNSIILCILLHLLVNMGDIVRAILYFDRQYIHKQRYGELLDSSTCYPELDL